MRQQALFATVSTNIVAGYEVLAVEAHDDPHRLVLAGVTAHIPTEEM